MLGFPHETAFLIKAYAERVGLFVLFVRTTYYISALTMLGRLNRCAATPYPISGAPPTASETQRRQCCNE